jgi:hypothetical protein
MSDCATLFRLIQWLMTAFFRTSRMVEVDQGKLSRAVTFVPAAARPSRTVWPDQQKVVVRYSAQMHVYIPLSAICFYVIPWLMTAFQDPFRFGSLRPAALPSSQRSNVKLTIPLLDTSLFTNVRWTDVKSFHSSTTTLDRRLDSNPIWCHSLSDKAQICACHLIFLFTTNRVTFLCLDTNCISIALFVFSHCVANVTYSSVVKNISTLESFVHSP